jgi:hypothetical protein
MCIQNHQIALGELYNNYNQNVKPLLADIEARYEKIPLQLFNEIRAFNDHIARCYLLTTSEEDIKRDLEKASSHLLRIILDCFKLLNLHVFSVYVEKFEKKHKRVDLNVVDSGNFIVRFYAIKLKARNTVREAKTYESSDKVKSLELFQRAYNEYSELETLIEENRRGISHAKRKTWIKFCLDIVKVGGGAIALAAFRYFFG